MDYTIASETLTHYQNYADRDSRTDFEKGEEDGRREYPDSDASKFSTYEQQLISAARTALNEYVRKMRQAVDMLDSKISGLMSERDEDYTSRKNALFEQKKQELKEVNDLYGTNSQRHKELDATYSQRRREFQAQEFDTGRPPRINMADPILEMPWLTWTTPYILALCALSLMEIPINSRAIELAFEFTPPLSYVIAGLVGVVFIMLAHFTGIQLLRIWHAPGWVKLWHILLAILSAGFATILVVIRFEMRGQVEDLTGSVSGVLALDADPGGVGSGLPEVRTSPDLLTLLFTDPLAFLDQITSGGSDEATRFAQLGLLLLNVIVFLTGLVLSVIRHDPDPAMERAHNRLMSAERKLNFFMRHFRNRAAGIESKFGRRITSTERRADQINNDIIACQREREQLLQQIDNDMRTVLNVLAQQIAAYQRGNRNARTTKEPAYFGTQGLRKLGAEVMVE